MEVYNSLNKVCLKKDENCVNFEFLNSKIIRVFKSKNKTDLIDLFIQNSNRKYELKKENSNISIVDKDFSILVNSLNNFSLSKSNNHLANFSLNVLFDEVEKRNYNNITIEINPNDNVFGLGDKMAYLDRKGYFWSSYNTDDSSHQDELFPSLYKSINYLLFRCNKVFFGIFFPSSYRYTFDVCKTDLNKVQVNNFDEEQDFFLILGSSIKEITSAYSELVGKPYFIRLKMLGYNQSRWSYENEKMVQDICDNFKKYSLPLDYIHLDIHYMDGYRDFTIDKTRFPNMKSLSDNLKKEDVELIVINDAAIKVDENFDIYNFLENNKLFGRKDDKTYVNVVWPGNSAFPNYFDANCKEYFKNYAKKFIEDNGISGIWCDMNEPASFEGLLPSDVDFSLKNRKLTHAEAHNIYGEHMVKSFVDTFKDNNVRPYLFSRAAFATSAKYCFVWNGDNFSLWHHLRYSIPQILSLSISGLMFNGVDIGGFGGDGNKELLIRWLEANLFMPFLRNHSSLNTRKQEPYAFDDETIQIYKKYLDIRYAFIPYLYNLAYRMHKYGEPIVSPLFYNYENDEKTLSINDEYMVGDKILVAPILDKDSKNRMVYLPKGKWINYFTNEILSGNKFIIVRENLAETGYFIKYNTLMPMFENLLHIDKAKIKTLVFKLFGKQGQTYVYEDDGHTMDYEKGVFNIYKASISNGKFTFKYVRQSYKSPFEKIKILYDDKIIEKPFKEYYEVEL